MVARYHQRVIHIQSLGRMYNGTVEIGGGSGLLVSDDLILTNSHVVPNKNNYKELTINMRVSRRDNPIAATEIARDAERDLALLRLERPLPGRSGVGCPMPILTQATQAPMGTSVFVLGFPLDIGLNVTSGVIGNQESENGRWITNAQVNVGNSGGPAFKADGTFVGIVVEGIDRWIVGEEEIDVEGLNFLIPAITISQSPVYRVIATLPDNQKCLRERTATEDIITSVNAISAASVVMLESEKGQPNGVRPQEPPASALPASFVVSRPVQQLKDDHPIVFSPHSRSLVEVIQATPNFRLESCGFEAASANNASMKCRVLADGSAAEFSLTLTSGPAVDRYRGWWSGTISALQVKR